MEVDEYVRCDGDDKRFRLNRARQVDGAIGRALVNGDAPDRNGSGRDWVFRDSNTPLRGRQQGTRWAGSPGGIEMTVGIGSRMYQGYTVTEPSERVLVNVVNDE